MQKITEKQTRAARAGVPLLWSTINLNQKVGDMELVWIIVSILVFAAFWITAFIVLGRLARRDRIRSLVEQAKQNYERAKKTA